jgi:hypothetical protein
MAANRCIEVDLSWTTETRHPNAASIISNELSARGWDYAQAEDDRKVFCREDGPDFDDQLKEAQRIVGTWLVEVLEMSDDPITIDKDSEERYVVLREGEQIADVVWNEDFDASLGKPEISEGKWFLCRVGTPDDEELTEANGKDDASMALEQARRLLSD